MPEEIIESNIETEMQSSYIDYAMSVIVGRALPDARDGLKPALRRILYAMYNIGNTHDQPTKKSARIVGETIGKFHPHGDMAVYEALIRMAQDFSMNYMLVQGQGNMGCFTKDTKVKLIDGRNLDFGELIEEQKIGKKHWTYAFNTKTQLIEITEIKNPRLTRKNAELIEITLDNDEKIKCTPDHKFLLHDGKYKQAKDLDVGSSLMPIYTKAYDGVQDKNLKDYETVLQPSTNDWQFVHRLSDEWNIKEGIYARSRGRIRHHKDFNKKNNNPDNITRVDWKEHWEIHYKLTSWKHRNDKEYVKKLAEGRRKYIENNRELFSSRLAERNRKNWKNPQYREYHSRLVKELWTDSIYRERMVMLSSKRLKNLWGKEEFQKLMSEVKSVEMKQRWKDSEYRLNVQKRTKEFSDRLWSDPKHRELISNKMKVLAADPKWAERQRKIAKGLWNNPSYRAKFSKDHFVEMGKKAWLNEKTREMHIKRTIKMWENPEFKQKAIENSRKLGIKRAKESPEIFIQMSRLSKQALHKNWQDPLYKQRVMRSKILGFVSCLLSKYSLVTPEIYESERKNNCIPKVTNALEYFSNFDQIIEQAKTRNHKVKNIIFLAEKEDVYDLTTDPWHNFALASGVFVHNSIDGDPPAAARYTEVRLSKIADEMLDDIQKESVKFVPNFDNTEMEPMLLPAKIPNLLINGSTGIAVGVATNIMPHNLSEVCDAVIAYVKNREITSQELLQFVQGPDLPTGGTVFYDNALLSSYLTGRGGITIRGKYAIEKTKNKTAIVITEIPYTVNKSSLVETIAENVKQKRIVGISDMRDESGKEGIRIVIELRQDADPDVMLNLLYKHTQLEISLPVMNIAVMGNNLVTLNLKQFIKVFVDHRIDVIRKRTEYDLRIASDRLHIVEGLLVAVNDIDNVVALIKASGDIKDARASLINSYSISEKQANAILDMKLSKLTSLETDSLLSEKKDLANSITELNGILADEQKIYGIIERETSEMKSKYGRERRTLIDKNVPEGEFNREDLLTDEQTTVIMTKNNYIKRIATKVYREQDRGGRGVIAIQLKEGDYVKQIVSCMLKDYLLLISNKGRAYWLKAYMVPEEGRYSSGKAAVNMVKLTEGEKVGSIINTRTFSDSFISFITVRGRIKRVRAEKFARPRANGIMAMPLNEGDELADVCISDGKSDLFIATRNGKALRFDENGIRPMSRISHGVRGIRLNSADRAINILSAKEQDLIASIAEKGYGKITELARYRKQKRGGKGVLNIKTKEKTGNVVKVLKATSNDNIIMINTKGISITFPVNDIRVTGRAASGVRLMRLDSGASIVDAQNIDKQTVPGQQPDDPNVPNS